MRMGLTVTLSAGNYVGMQTTDTLSEQVADAVRAQLAYRRRRGLSPTSARELAAQIGLSQSAMSARLTGATPIDLNELELIARAFDMPVAELLPAKQETKRRSILAVEPATPMVRTDEMRVGRGTPTLADPPSMTPIRSASEQAVTTGRISRPTRLSTTSAGGETR